LTLSREKISLGSNSERQLSAPEGVRREVAGVAAAYYGSAKLGLDLAFETTSVTAVWPRTGIALAAVVLCGCRIWPGVALGALLANGWTGVPLYAVLGITVGNTLEALVGAYHLRRLGDFRPSLEEQARVQRLVGRLRVVLSRHLNVELRHARFPGSNTQRGP
jgi:integral membrane sensor domain MASE1